MYLNRMDYEGEDARINTSLFFFNANSIGSIEVSLGLWIMHFWTFTPLPESLPGFPEKDDSGLRPMVGPAASLPVTLGKVLNLSRLPLHQQRGAHTSITSQSRGKD